jgi:hypothetical protein
VKTIDRPLEHRNVKTNYALRSKTCQVFKT